MEKIGECGAFADARGGAPQPRVNALEPASADTATAGNSEQPSTCSAAPSVSMIEVEGRELGDADAAAVRP